jgi:hypothetical protein
MALDLAMSQRFQKHYTRDEARDLLPKVRAWLKRLNVQRVVVEKFEQRLAHLLHAGHDTGGDTVNQLIRSLADMREILREFQEREIQIKDIERGLVDFPAILAGKEVFLCWEQDEEDIEFWHDLETGFAGRERL